MVKSVATMHAVATVRSTTTVETTTTTVETTTTTVETTTTAVETTTTGVRTTVRLRVSDSDTSKSRAHRDTHYCEFPH